MIIEQQNELLKRVEALEKEVASRDEIIAEKDEKIASLDKEVSSNLEKIASLDKEVSSGLEKIASLEYQLYWLRKKVLGKMSEKRLPLDPSALNEPTLFGDELSEEERTNLQKEADKEIEDATKTIKVAEHERKARKAIDTSKLEVKEVHLRPKGINTEEYTELAPEISDKLVLVPAQMYVERTIRHKYVLKSNLQIQDPDRPAFEIAPLPESPIYKSMASASLLTDIIIQKYYYHLPFYRVIQKYKEMGVTISDSTINDWFAAVCEMLKPLYDKLRDVVMESDYVQVDESTLPVIDNEKHRAVKGYMWDVLAVESGMNFFHYDNGSRSKETARRLLCGYHGAMQCDGYDAYNQFEQMGVKVLACWAHVRRKFVDALEENQRLATEAIVYIKKLYKVESEADEQGLTPEQRCEKRKAEAYPVILEFEKWLIDTDRKVMNSSRMGKAIAYTFSLLPRLSIYVTDGRYRIDDNPIENTIRPLAIGRKNYLFCGNKAAAYRAAIVYSLISCCKSADVDPRVWLEDVLNRLPAYESGKKDVTELLPKYWKERFAHSSGN